MRKSPLNYLIAIALGALLWVITAIFIGGSFSDSLMLAEATPEEFLASLQVFLGIAALLGILNTVYWYHYGGLSSTIGNLNKASRVWWSSFIVQIIIGVALLVVLVIMNMAEGVATTDWIIVFLMISLHTWIFFWVCTYLMSPRAVQYIPLFK